MKVMLVEHRERQRLDNPHDFVERVAVSLLIRDKGRIEWAHDVTHGSSWTGPFDLEAGVADWVYAAILRPVLVRFSGCN